MTKPRPPAEGSTSPSGGEPVAGEPRPSVVWLLVTLVVAAWARATNWAGVYAGGLVFVTGVHGHVHLRRAELTLEHFPRVPVFDAWMNAPDGAFFDSPLGFDLALATFCKVVMGVGGDTVTAAQAAVLFNPFLGVVVCLVLFFAGRQLVSPRAGLVAAVIGAVLPMLAAYSSLGRIDHHAAEPLLVLLPLMSLWSALDAATLQRRHAWAWLAGATLAAGVLVWPGALLVSGVAFASLMGLWVAQRDLDRRWASIGRHVFAAAVVVGAPVTMIHPWGDSLAFEHGHPSWLQPLAYLVAWVCFEAAFRVFSRGRVAARVLRFGLVAVVAAVCWLVAYATLPRLGPALADTWRDVAGDAGRLPTWESRPLGSFGWLAIHRDYTGLAYAAPLLTMAAWRARLSDKHQLLHLALVITGCLALLQLRLGSLFSPLWCLAWGAAVVEAVAMLSTPGVIRPTVASAAVGTAMLVPIAVVLPQHAPMVSHGTGDFVRTSDALDWLRDHAAHPGDDRDPTTPPAFSVMGRWQWGDWLTQICHQANVASPMDHAAASRRGIEDSVRFFLSTEPAEAEAILERRRSRYVLVSSLAHELDDLAPRGGHRLDYFLHPDSSETGAAELPFFEMMNSRLLLFDGLAVKLEDTFHPPLVHLRLVFESPGLDYELRRLVRPAKVFEVVASAAILGTARPHDRVALTLLLSTNRKRKLRYRDEAKADAEGRFRFEVPYPTEALEGVTALGPYRLISSSGSVDVLVTLADVRLGRTVMVEPL